MQQQIQGQVLGVTSETSKKGKPYYKISFSDGNVYTAFEAPIATKAHGLTGQQVTATVTVEQNGQYTNRNLNDIAPSGSAPALVIPPGASVAAPQPAGAPASPQVALGPIPASQSVSDADRQRLIVAQSSIASAANFLGGVFHGFGPEGIEAAKAELLPLAENLFRAVFATITPQASAPAPVHETPAAVAEFANAQLGEGVVQVGAPAVEDAKVQW